MFLSNPIAESLPDKTLGHLSGIATDIHVLMQMKENPALYNCKHLLLARLSEMGFATAGARIRQQKLEEQFVIFYGHDLLDMLESMPKQNDHNWLACTTRSMRYAVHPLRQMLLFRFLYGSFKGFLDQSRVEYHPFGKGPWPCLNKAAEHYREPVIIQCQITRCSDTGHPVGTFRCECGFSYSRRGPDQSDDDKFHRGRIKSFGSIWVNKLQKCLQSGLSYRSTADILGVDTNTVIKYADGVIIEHKPGLNVSEKKKKSSHLFKPKECKQARVDWEKRDLELSWLVEETCKALLTDQNSNPVRIRIATIGKRIGKLSMLEKHKDKLPITMNVLSNYLESLAQFQSRRVQWAAEQMNGEWPLKRWKLVRKAGLRPGYSPEVDGEINRCIGRNTYIHPFTTTEVTQWLH